MNEIMTRAFNGRMSGHDHQVEGTRYHVWGNYITRSSFAMNVDTQEIHEIYTGGYISNDLTVRKAIARKFGHETFRK